MIVEFVSAAELELSDAVDYFNEKRTGLGVKFAEDVNQAILRIIEYPNAWQYLGRHVRRCQLTRFEYSLVYRVVGDVATVYAVMHLKRRPRYWRKRLAISDK